MRQRYTVCNGDRAFASIHAATAEEAIALACTKVSGHDLKNCTATTVTGERANDGGPPTSS